MYFQWIRYIPTRCFGRTSGDSIIVEKETQVSSTRIRRILAEVEDKDDMVKALLGTALSPELLVQYVQRYKREAQGRVQSIEANTNEDLSEKMNELHIEGAQADEWKGVKQDVDTSFAETNDV